VQSFQHDPTFVGGNEELHGPEKEMVGENADQSGIANQIAKDLIALENYRNEILAIRYLL
jgi:hypothetical protein